MEEKFKGDVMRFILLILAFFAQISFGAQHDYVIDNQTGALFRADINSALQANQNQNSGTSAPATTYAFQFWMDTSGATPILKMRNAANSAWIVLGDASLTGLGLLDRTGGTISGALTVSGDLTLTGRNTAGGVLYGNGTKILNTGAGTAGHVLISNGASAPAFASISSLAQAPTIQRFTSGSGTYTTPAGVKYIRVTAVGGGGGGMGSNIVYTNNLSTTSLTAGSATTFGTSLITANGGAAAGGGTFSLIGGAGGTATITTSSSVLNQLTVTGGNGGQGSMLRTTSDIITGSFGGYGGGTYISPINASGGYGQPGVSAPANTGAGGGGAGMSNVGEDGRMGGGGGGGGTAIAIITSPSATYSYSVGAGGTGATGDTYVGGNGGSGIIIVEEYYLF